MSTIIYVQYVQQVLRPRERKLGLGRPMTFVEHLNFTHDVFVGSFMHSKQLYFQF